MDKEKGITTLDLHYIDANNCAHMYLELSKQLGKQCSTGNSLNTYVLATRLEYNIMLL